MTETGYVRYCAHKMEAWQSRAAFVVQFRESTDVEAGRLEGRIEHIASCQATRFHSSDELFAFVGRVLADIRNTTPATAAERDWSKD